MDLKNLNVKMNIRAYVPQTPSSAIEIKGTIRAINDGRVAIDFKDKDNVSQTIEVRPVDVMEILK